MWVQWVKALQSMEERISTFMESNGVPRRTAEQLFGLHTMIDVSIMNTQSMRAAAGSLRRVAAALLHHNLQSVVIVELLWIMTRHTGFEVHRAFM